MKQTRLSRSIVVALMAISHNRIDYPAGSVFEVPEKDVVFLQMSGYVREPTADELTAYEERQTVAQVEATEPDESNHAGLVPKPTSDNEPDAPVIDESQSTTKTHDIAPSTEEAPAEQPEQVTAEEVEMLQPEAVESEVAKSPYDGWLKKDLNAELDGREIEHDAAARNDELEALLVADDAAQSKAAE